MKISEETFSSWAQGPSKTETEKCQNAELAIRKAIAFDEKLSDLDISIFAQGSYGSRTNVKQDSDVDICVCYKGSFFPEYPPGMTKEDFGNIDGAMRFDDFKNMIESALKSYFGTNEVVRGNKAFDVHENTYRIDADVVPTFEHRWYTGKRNSDLTWSNHKGVAFISDNGNLIKNWPQQNYDNGVNRNDSTGRRYKRVIRILKRLRNKMQDDKITEANDIASFLIECLVWNAPLEAFKHDTYTEILTHLIASLWGRTQKEEDCKDWGEVNELKDLFRPSQPWTRVQVNKFLYAAWSYAEFK